jgi:hypothetical protein
MANAVDQHPWVLDTAGLITTDDLYISKLRWVGGASSVADDQLIVQDKNGKVIFESTATGANFIDELSM